MRKNTWPFPCFVILPIKAHGYFPFLWYSNESQYCKFTLARNCNRPRELYQTKRKRRVWFHHCKWILLYLFMSRKVHCMEEDGWKEFCSCLYLLIYLRTSLLVHHFVPWYDFLTRCASTFGFMICSVLGSVLHGQVTLHSWIQCSMIGGAKYLYRFILYVCFVYCFQAFVAFWFCVIQYQNVRTKGEIKLQN